MTLNEIATKLSLKVQTAPHKLDREVTGSQVSDQIGVVLARATCGQIWVTTKASPNIVPLAMLADLAGVIVAGGMPLERSTLEKAGKICIPLLTTDLSAAQVAGELSKLGIGG